MRRSLLLSDDEISFPSVQSELLVEFKSYLQLQVLAERTIKSYSGVLKSFDADVEAYLGNPNLRAVKMKYAAYRAYLQFLGIKKKRIDRRDLADMLNSLKPKKKGGNNQRLKQAYPKSQWREIIRKTPTCVGKMGVWFGLEFGLRLNEITHLRVQDVYDQKRKKVLSELLIRKHQQTSNQEAWWPKYNNKRELPIAKNQVRVIKRWIEEVRPKDLAHPYLLWTERGPRKHQLLKDRSFQRWCNLAGVRPHELRYSFATHYYNESKDVKLISDLLGHANVSTTSEYLQFGKKETMSKARALFAQS